jgi:hypothetical protein
MYYVFNFVVEILLVLTFALRSVDQTLNDSTFYVMWVVELQTHWEPFRPQNHFQN